MGLIAAGGMGSVYRARDTVLDRTVALKVLRTGGDDPEFVARFKVEATNAARLSHPNIVQVYDFGYADGSPFMAMEYVDGQTLRDVLHARTVLRPDIATRIASQVAAALEAARRHGLVHRDVKPENILITTDGRVKVADFGLSYALSEARATQAGTLLGTAHYLSPEQVEGISIDHRSDIYSLGIVLYEMLTGRPPFGGDSPVVIAYKRVAEDVPSALGVNADVPRELDEVIARATAREPHQRYATAGAMADALRGSAPRSDTDDIGALVHHTMAIPIAGEETTSIPRRARQVAKRRSRRRLKVLALLAAILTGAVWLYNGPLERIDVPRVIGQRQAEARRTLAALGFGVDQSLENDPTVPPGEVIAQLPEPGTQLTKNSTVTLVVSLGPTIITLPAVAGMRFSRAEDRLREQGFRVTRMDVFDDEIERLHVVAQEPPAGSPLEEGSVVTLHVSKGIEKFPVPDLVGDLEASAREDLEDQGFTVKIERKRHPKIPEGAVISQDPKPGTKLIRGERVTLVVSKGPVMVKVPDLECMTKRQAEDTLVAKGFKADFSGRGAYVVDQAPSPGSSAAEGSTITAYMGFGSYC